MSNNGKIIAWIVVVVVVVGVLGWWIATKQQVMSPSYNNTSGTLSATSSVQGNGTSNNGVSATDDSNAALQSDTASIDGQMNGFSSDNASINQSMNDQPVQQSQF